MLLHPVKDPTRFGIAKINIENRILSIIEKPTLDLAQNYQSNGFFYAIAGLLVLKSRIFEHIDKTKKGINGEFWLTDSIELLRLSDGRVFGYKFDGKRFDIGTFESLRLADKVEQENHK